MEGYENGHRIIDYGGSDGFNTVRLCPSAVESFDNMRKGLSRDYCHGNSVEKLTEEASGFLENVEIGNTLNALAITVALDRARLYCKGDAKSLKSLADGLLGEYDGLKGQYILKNIPGKSLE
ncbi:hypothetical protein HN903_01535 [archaeon]|nr:hypothetical protein [archaeon]MBT7128414.1 hypothetical protein [archaeon]